MSKIFMILSMFIASFAYAEPVKLDSEIALEELFSEEDLAAFNEEEQDIDLFDEISQADAPIEEIFQ